MMPKYTLNVDDLSMRDRILLVSLAASLKPGHSEYSSVTLLNGNITPTDQLTHELVHTLTSLKAITIEPRSINVEDSYNYMLSFKLPNNKELLEGLLTKITSGYNPNEILDENVRDLALNVICSESVQYIKSELFSQGIDLLSLQAIPEPLIKIHTQRPCSEVNMLLWQTLSNLPGRDIRLYQASNSNLLNLISEKAYLLHKEYQRNNRTVKEFKRKYNYNTSTVSCVLFDHYFRLGPEYFYNKEIVEIIKSGRTENINN